MLLLFLVRIVAIVPDPPLWVGSVLLGILFCPLGRFFLLGASFGSDSGLLLFQFQIVAAVVVSDPAC